MLVSLLCLLSEILFAQVLISGKVIDRESGEPVSGVHISISESVKGTVTDHQGLFSMHVQDTATSLTFSSLGFQPEERMASSSSMLVRLRPSLVELIPVVVSAGGGSQLRSDAALAISKIPRRMLKEAKAGSLDQVLNKINGVYMVNLGNEQHSMSIRQPLSLKSLFLYLEDGIPLRPTGIYNHNALIEMNMVALQSIEVMKGPASSIYGSEAIGGSINFITKSPPENPSGKIGVQRDNLGYKRMDFEAGGNINKVGIYSGGYYANRSHGYQQHSDFHKLAFTLRGNYEMGVRDKITASLSFIDYKSDMAGSIDSTDFYGENYFSMHTFTYRKVKALRIRGSWDHFWNDRSKTAFNLIYRNNLMGQNPAYRIKNNSQNPLKASGEINQQTFQSYGTLVHHTQELGFMDARIVGGVSLDLSPSRFAAEFIEVERNDSGLYTAYHSMDSLLTHYRVNLLNTAAFAQFEVSPINQLKLILAGRYDYFLYHYDNYLTPDANNAFNHLSPKVGFTYGVKEGKGIYGNYSIGFSPPQVSELYRGVKTPILEPSIYSNYELGGWWGFGKKTYLEVSLYQMNGTNEIIRVFQDDGTTENRNAGRTIHRGIEYAINYSPFKSLRLRFGGTNARHEFVEYVENGYNYNGKRMDAAPAWIANGEMFYYPAFLNGFRIGMEWQHMSSYYMDPNNTEKYKGFNVLNLRLGYEYKKIESWINILNLADVHYATSASKSNFGKRYSQGDPRTFSVGLAIIFDKAPK